MARPRRRPTPAPRADGAPPHHHPDPVVVVRPSPVLRAALCTMAAVAVPVCAWALAVAVGDGSWSRAAAVALLAAGLAALALRYALAVRLVLDHDEMVVANLLQTRRLPRGDVIGAIPGHYGVVVRRRGGQPVVATVVQASRSSRWRGRTSRADAVAEAVSGWAAPG